MNTNAFILMIIIVLAQCPAYGTAMENEEQHQQAMSQGPLTTGPLITDTAVPQDPGSGTLYMPLYLRFGNKNFDARGDTQEAGQDSYSAIFPVQIFYGIAERTEAYIIIPYRENWVTGAAEPGPGGERTANYGGIGDINVSLKYLFSKETATTPALSALLGTNIPIGHHRNLDPALLGADLLGTGSYSFIFGVNAYKYADPLKLYGNIWYMVSTAATQDTQRLYPRDSTIFNMAVEYLVSARWVLLGELLARWDDNRLFGNDPNTPRLRLFSTVPGIEFIATKTLNFSAGVKIDIAGKNISRDYAPIIAAFYYF